MVALLQRINKSLILNKPNGGAKAIINLNTATKNPRTIKMLKSKNVQKAKEAERKNNECDELFSVTSNFRNVERCDKLCAAQHAQGL